MQFGWLTLAHSGSPDGDYGAIQDLVEQACFAEAAGFDGIWLTEHNFTGESVYCDPIPFASVVAARTSRIRIGFAVIQLALRHPIRLAIELALLDNLSGGRLDLGAGRGATLQEMSLCGVDPDRTYSEVEEALRMIGRMWQEDTFEWHGDLLTVEPLPGKEPHPVLPRPIQRPHPPLYLACTKRDTVALAAEYGIGALVLGFSGPDDIAGLRKIYDDGIKARTGKRFVSASVNNHFSALCPTIVLDDAHEAFQVGARGQRFFAEAIAHWYGGGPPPDPGDIRADQRAEIEHSRDDMVARLHEAKIPAKPNELFTFNLVEHAYGDSKDAIAYAERLQDAGADEIMCLIQMGTVPQAACMETIRHWGEQVIPHFRKKEG